MSNSTFQKVFFQQETTFGDADGVYSADTRLWPADKVDLSQLEQQMHSGDQVTGNVADLGVLPVATFQNFEFSTNHLISGATRTTGVITPDETSKVLAVAAGTSSTPFAIGTDTIATGTSATSITLTTGDASVVAGILLAVDTGDNGKLEVRKVATYPGAKVVTFMLPLSSATPTVTGVVLPVEDFVLSGVKKSCGIGIENTLDAWDVTTQGVIANFKPDTIVANEPVKATIDWKARNWVFGTGLITAVAPVSMETAPVIPQSGGGFSMLDESGALFTACVSSCEITNPFEESFIECIGATNGRGDHVMTPTDKPLATMKLKLYALANTYTEMTDMIGHESEICVQIGSTSGSIVGYYMDKAKVTAWPKPNDTDKKWFIEVEFSGTNLRLFRA
jgi:hypothetical protein